MVLIYASINILDGWCTWYSKLYLLLAMPCHLSFSSKRGKDSIYSLSVFPLWFLGQGTGLPNWHKPILINFLQGFALLSHAFSELLMLPWEEYKGYSWVAMLTWEKRLSIIGFGSKFHNSVMRIITVGNLAFGRAAPSTSFFPFFSGVRG